MTARQIFKALGRGLALVAVFPHLLSYWARAPFLGRDRALEGSSQWLSLVPGLTGQYVRRAFLSCVLEQCHHSAVIEFGVVFSRSATRIEENVYIGPRCHIGWVHLERDSLLAAGVHVPSGPYTHVFEDDETPIREQPADLRPVRIGAGSWIGSAAVVLADVGRNSVVGAGAVVTRPIPDGVVAAGVPARVLKQR